MLSRRCAHLFGAWEKRFIIELKCIAMCAPIVNSRAARRWWWWWWWCDAVRVRRRTRVPMCLRVQLSPGCVYLLRPERLLSLACTLPSGVKPINRDEHLECRYTRSVLHSAPAIIICQTKRERERDINTKNKLTNRLDYTADSHYFV